VERYVIRGGQAGYERLQVLARERWPDTAALLDRVGVKAGMRCIDLGCGGGEVTFEIARLVAPGTVTGVDMDEVKLELARNAAAERGFDNVAFTARNLNEWTDESVYDLVYARFVLQHLSRPVDLLRRMWAAVRPGGAIAVEDADFDGWACDPLNNGFDFFVRTYAEAIHRRGGDHALGRKLLRYFAEAEITGPDLNLVQPVYTAGDPNRLALSTLESSSEAILSEGIASEEELHAAIESLRRFSNDPGTFILGPRIFQLWSRR
jgi:ubiquinone/menaquinone biosynthesis C-methylase UbiE